MTDPNHEIPNPEVPDPHQAEDIHSEESKLALPDEPLLTVEADLTNYGPQSDLNSPKEDENMAQDVDEESNLPENMWVPEPEQDVEAGEGSQTAAGMGVDPELPTGATPPPVPPPQPDSESKPDSEERTWAMLAHLSILLNLVSGFLGPVAAFIIYLVYKDKSRYVAYQALQAFVFQLIWWVGAGMLIAIMWIFVGLLTLVIIGICLVPFAILLSMIPLAALVYGVIGGIQANQGDDFSYWLIGDWLRGTLTGD